MKKSMRDDVNGHPCFEQGGLEDVLECMDRDPLEKGYCTHLDGGGEWESCSSGGKSPCLGEYLCRYGARDYVLLEDEAHRLAASVSSQLRKGWRLHGETFFAGSHEVKVSTLETRTVRMYAQAMVCYRLN